MKHLLVLIFTTIILPYNISFSKPPPHISSSGLLLIKASEGFRPYPYKDLNGNKIIGHGHKIRPLENLGHITLLQADQLLRQDIQASEICLKRLSKYPFSQSQFDALISFIFNIGCENFRNSHVYYYLVLRDYKNMKIWWKKWVHDKNSAVLKGLLKRREEEIELFEKRL